jgi:hypothetical protein
MNQRKIASTKLIHLERKYISPFHTHDNSLIAGRQI